jgi:hypothetical protein
MPMRGTGAGKQDRDIRWVSVGETPLPLGDHAGGAADGIGDLLVRPFRMLLEELAQMGSSAHAHPFP